MVLGDSYRDKAAELHAKAQLENNERLRAEFEGLALQYLRLAEQADRNAKTDVVYEAVPVQTVIPPGQPDQEKPET